MTVVYLFNLFIIFNNVVHKFIKFNAYNKQIVFFIALHFNYAHSLLDRDQQLQSERQNHPIMIKTCNCHSQNSSIWTMDPTAENHIVQLQRNGKYVQQLIDIWCIWHNLIVMIKIFPRVYVNKRVCTQHLPIFLTISKTENNP